MNYNDLIIPIRPNICPNCGVQAIELFSFNGYPQKYKERVNFYISGIDTPFDKYEIRFMKCKSCNKEFIIDWSDLFPKPLRDTSKLNRFLSEFIVGI